MKNDFPAVRNIVFDLGRVLLNLDFEASVSAFEKLNHAGSPLNIEMVFSDPLFLNFEIGQITPEQFRKRVREILNNPAATDRQIDDAWYAMVLDIPERRVQMLKELAETHAVYLFSNTNPIHTQRFISGFKKQYGFDFSSLFIKDFYSHDIQARKPDVTAFQKVIELAGINARETLFIDDLKENVEGARQAGLKAFWLQSGMEISDFSFS